MRCLKFGVYFFRSLITLYILKIDEYVVQAQSKGDALAAHEPGDQRTVFVPANSTCIPPATKCDPSYRFYSFDGSCNNLKFTSWGQAGTLYRRMFNAAYSSASGALRVSVVDGSALPNARLLRLICLPDAIVLSKKSTTISYGMAQLITHDVTSFNSLPIPVPCCINGRKANPLHPACMPLDIPQNDPFYSKFGITCLSMTRANCSYDARCNLHEARVPFNFVTGCFDLSMIYSNNKNLSDSLREMKGGRLATWMNNFQQPFFPMFKRCPVAFSSNCWALGDQRVSVCPELALSALTLFRCHNLFANNIGSVTKGWSDQKIFDYARKLLIACTQNTYYGEYLLSVLGARTCNKYKLLPLQTGLTTYNSQINPTSSVEFIICSRLFHSQIVGTVGFSDSIGSSKFYKLSDVYSNQTFLMPDIRATSLMQTYATTDCNQLDEHGIDDVSNKLFQQNGVGSDLGAMDIQRSRDMGMPDYVSLRRLLGFKTISSFDDLKTILKDPDTNIKKLKTVYKSVRDLDTLLVAYMERTDTDAIVGPTCSEVLGSSYNAFKFGDRFYFEHNQKTGFSQAVLKEIRKVKLSHIICWANPFSAFLVPQNAYEIPSISNRVWTCKDLFALKDAPNIVQIAKLMSQM